MDTNINGKLSVGVSFHFPYIEDRDVWSDKVGQRLNESRIQLSWSHVHTYYPYQSAISMHVSQFSHARRKEQPLADRLSACPLAPRGYRVIRSAKLMMTYIHSFIHSCTTTLILLLHHNLKSSHWRLERTATPSQMWHCMQKLQQTLSGASKYGQHCRICFC